MRDVHNKLTEGHHVKDEATMAIVPILRGGEPMALGISEALPLARFFHAKHPQDLILDDGQNTMIDGCTTVILVDWVINTGKTITEFVRYLRFKLKYQVRIIVVAGVIQNDAADNLKRALTG